MDVMTPALDAALRCPDCRARLDAGTLRCANGHRFDVEDGVLILLSAGWKRRLAGFLGPFGQLRAAAGKRLTDPADYQKLPFGAAVAGNHEWRLRQLDLAVVSRLLAPFARRHILEIGAWNGWLSNRLAGLGHRVVATDYFTDPYDGLKARQFFANDWLAIQMNLEDLSILDQQFDVVIVNHCLQFFADPSAYAAMALDKVASGGLLILIGLGFLRDPTERLAGLTRLRAQLNEHGIDFFKAMKGYLDMEDRARIEGLGVRLHGHRQLWRANLKARLLPTAPWYRYGVLSRP